MFGMSRDVGETGMGPLWELVKKSEHTYMKLDDVFHNISSSILLVIWNQIYTSRYME